MKKSVITKKRYEERISQQLHEIFDICLNCNGFESRAAGETGALPTVFFDFSGHVSRLDVRIYPDGWSSGGHCKYFQFCTDQDIRVEEIEALRAYAQHALTEKKESEVIERSILAKKEEIKNQKESLKALRKSLKKAEAKEKAAATA